MGYNFFIEYKKGKENVVADALSRKVEDVGLCAQISFLMVEWVGELRQSYQKSEEYSILMEKLLNHKEVPKGTPLQQGIILRKGRILIVPDSPFKLKVLQFIHTDPMTGHSGYLKTYQRAKRDFYWPGMKKNIKRWVECEICQASKYETLPPVGLLQPLPIPQ